MARGSSGNRLIVFYPNRMPGAKLRVLIQPRGGFFQDRGGDNVQLECTVNQLGRLGIDVDVSIQDAINLSSYDLVHIFNFGGGWGEIRYLTNAHRQKKPIVISPIYWNMERALRLRSEVVPPADTREKQELVETVERSRREIERRVRSALLRHVDLILTLSHSEGELLVRDFGAPQNRFRVIHNGVEAFFANADPSIFAQRFGPRDFVLCAGRISIQKNQIGLIRAWRNEKVPLVLIGKEEDPRYAALCRREAGPNTLFLPELPRPELASAYAAARVHALVSWYEMMPLAALEAGLAGCNLVLTTETAGPEFFGDAPWYCDPADPVAIRGAIHAAHEAPRNGRLVERIRERFTWERTAQQTAEAYHEAIALHQLRQPDQSEDYVTCLEDLVSEFDHLIDNQSVLAHQLWLEKIQTAELLHRIERGRVMRVLKILSRLANL